MSIQAGVCDGREYYGITYERVECEEHIALAEKASRESIVLLKNDGILPLDIDNIKTIGVIGPNADSRRALTGNYHGTSSEYVTVIEGIREYVGRRARVLFSEGCSLFEDRTESLALAGDRLAEAQIVADHSDVVVLCLGLDETLEGEEGARRRFCLERSHLPGIFRSLSMRTVTGFRSSRITTWREEHIVI